ncbi:DUF6172 family protein, partial [Oleiphilus sp. HI0128]
RHKHYTAHSLNSLAQTALTQAGLPMKKTYQLAHPKIKVPRVVDSVKHDIRKFLKKERKKPLPSGTKYWGFDCKFGQSEEAAVEIQLPSLMSHIDELVANNIMTIYVEITAKAVSPDGNSIQQEY